MAKYTLTSEWTQMPFTEGTIQNVSSIGAVELSEDTEDSNKGVIIESKSECSWSGQTVYARAMNQKASVRVVPFSSTGVNTGAINDLINANAQKISNLETQHATDISNITTSLSSIKASQITEGTIDIARLPKAVIERVYIVTDNDAKLALTINDVQNGDTVKVRDTNKLFAVVDDSKLGTENAFEEFVTDVVVSGDIATSCTGNSATATKLQNSVNIYGNTFDGTQNINVISEDGTSVSANQAVKVNSKGQLMAGDLLKTVRCADNATDIASLAGEAIDNKEIVSNWKRISCEASTGANQNATTDAQTSAREAYNYNETYDAIICTQNSDPFSAFLSGEEYEPDYTVKYIIDNRILAKVNSSLCGDDDGLVFICGYMVDSNGKFHTLSVWRVGDAETSVADSSVTTSTSSHGTRFAICYDTYTAWIKNRTAGTGLTLANTVKLTKTNWTSSAYAYCQVQKTKNQIIAKTSNVNDSNLSCTLTFTLPNSASEAGWTTEQYNNIKYMMENNSKIGFGTESNCSAFQILSMSGSIGRTTIYDFQNIKTLQYENGSLVSSTDIPSGTIKPNTFYFSTLTKKLFYAITEKNIVALT